MLGRRGERSRKAAPVVLPYFEIRDAFQRFAITVEKYPVVVDRNNTIGGTLQHGTHAFLRLKRPDEVCLRLHAVALNGVAKGPWKRAIFDLAFDQIVLRAFLHRFGGQLFVVQAC